MEKSFGTIMQTKDGVFEVYGIDNKAGIVVGYKCFPSFCGANPCRTFKINEVVFHNMRDK